MSAKYPASTISVKCIGTSPPTCVATKVEGNVDITEADLTAEGTAVRDDIVETVRRTLSASKAPASDKPYITIKDDVGAVIGTDGKTATITRDMNAQINFNNLVTTNSKGPIVWKIGVIPLRDGIIPKYIGEEQVFTGTVGEGTDAASVTITVKPPDEAAKPTITIKSGEGVVIGEGGTTATITRAIGSEINFNELVTTSVTPITWTMGNDSGRVPLKDGIIPKYIGKEQVFTGTVGTVGTGGTASVTITVKPPVEAAKPAQFTIKIKQDIGVYPKDGKNYIDKKPSDTLDLNTLVDVEPATAGIMWTTGFNAPPPNGILNETKENTEKIYTGTVAGAPFGNSKAVISITVKTTGAAAGGRRKKGSTLRRRVGRILRKTATRGKRG